MISVVVYGRNDSHGYNLAKRAAISLNCIAQVLDAPDDEIIFVDCNTPDEIPTFPESIADTLSPRARQLLRVLRLRPELYARNPNCSKFKVFEPLCRNIAIRRSNPSNRWILNTNTDMVFTPVDPKKSLSKIVADLPDGFYELPRFEVPESLWESTNRMDPLAIIDSFRHWGLRFHINEIVAANEESLFDAPGDFQLCLREQLFLINGMNELMSVGRLHVDSNMCRRMWLLNGKTESLLDRLYGFHCDHTRMQSVIKPSDNTAENSFADFFVNVTTPYVPEQAATWGLPEEALEEIRLDEYRLTRIHSALEQILPGMARPIAGLSTVNCFDVGLFYNNHHVLPYVVDIIVNFHPHQNIGYFGCNVQLLGMLADLRRLLGHSGKILPCTEFLQPGSPIPGCIPATLDNICKIAGSYLVDLSMKHLPSRSNEIGLPIPDICPENVQFVREMSKIIIEIARYENNAVNDKRPPLPTIFVGCHGTVFDETIKSLFSCAMTPANTYVKNGQVSPKAFSQALPILPLHYYVIGTSISDITAWISKYLNRPVSHEETSLAQALYNIFLGFNGKQRPIDALETLLSLDAGRGILEMHMEIFKINGVPEQSEALRSFIDDYEKRPYKK